MRARAAMAVAAAADSPHSVETPGRGVAAAARKAAAMTPWMRMIMEGEILVRRGGWFGLVRKVEWGGKWGRVGLGGVEGGVEWSGVGVGDAGGAIAPVFEGDEPSTWKQPFLRLYASCLQSDLGLPFFSSFCSFFLFCNFNSTKK